MFEAVEELVASTPTSKSGLADFPALTRDRQRPQQT